MRIKLTAIAGYHGSQGSHVYTIATKLLGWGDQYEPILPEPFQILPWQSSSVGML